MKGHCAAFTDRIFIIFRSNLLGTHFTVYDDGKNPKHGMVGARKELIGIVYVSDKISNLITPY